MDFINSLPEQERADLATALREPNTFLAKDMDDVIAILQTLKR